MANLNPQDFIVSTYFGGVDAVNYGWYARQCNMIRVNAITKGG